MFTINHFIWIGICIVIVIGMTIISKKLNFSLKTASIVMAIVSIISELSKIFTHMKNVSSTDITKGMVIEAGALPLHLCSIFIFLFMWLPFSKESDKRKFLLNFCVPISIVGGSMAIIMATSGVSFVEPYAYQCFIYHAFMVWFAIYLIMSKNCDLGIKSFVKNVVSLFALSIIMIWVNGALAVYNTNFLYVVRPPVKNLPILNLNNGWFVYYCTLVVIGVIALLLVHLPSIIKEHKSKKIIQNESEDNKNQA